MAYIILAAALLVGGWLIIKWFTTANPKTIRSVLIWTLALLGLGLTLFALWGGVRQIVIASIPMLIPALLRWRPLWHRIKASMGPKAGQSSGVETDYLQMKLDHDTGEMLGTIKQGVHRGKHLEEVPLDELVELWRECRVEDPASADLLETYLDRTHGELWRSMASAQEGGDPYQAAQGGAMSEKEACEILGVRPGSTAEEIRKAHRSMMQKYHPDRGGSDYLASKINEAKDLLLSLTK